MDRIPEHDLMDTVEQARAYSDTDFSEAHDAFVSHFMAKFPEFRRGRVLDLGCGTADVVIRFARALPEVMITGVDGAQAMLDIGMRDIKSNCMSHQIRLHKCMLPDNNLLKKKFGAVISNSLLHHLDDPSIIWDIIINCAGPGAPVFIMDLFRPDSVNLAEELVDLYAANASPVLRADFYNSLLAAYDIKEIRQQLALAGLDYLYVDKVSDRHVLVWGTHQ